MAAIISMDLRKRIFGALGSSTNTKRTIDDFRESFEQMLLAFGKSECSNYSKNCEYLAIMSEMVL